MQKQRLRPVELKSTGGKAPREIRLFKFGPNETTKGTFILDEAGAKSCLEKFAAYGNDLAIDFEHQTFEPVKNGMVEAAGWIPQGGLEVREGDGLYARVEWTDDVKAAIEARKLRYYSPTFITDDDNRVIEILPIAVTNYPATIGLQPLIARRLSRRRAHPKRNTMAGIQLSFVSLAAAMDAAQAAVAAKFGEGAEVADVTDTEIVFSVGGKTYAVAYAVEEDGSISFVGEPVEVEEAGASSAATEAGAATAAPALKAKAKRVSFVSTSRLDAIELEMKQLRTELRQKDEVVEIVASMRKAGTWTPAREQQIKRVAASMGVKDARELSGHFGPGVKLHADSTHEPEVSTSSEEKPYEEMTSIERHALAKSNPKKFAALRSAAEKREGKSR